MHAAVMKKEKELGLKVLWATTAEQNKVVLKTSSKAGWKHVQFSPYPIGCDYYSVIIAKWTNKCPYSDRRISFMYNLSKIIVKVLYKPGHVSRFKF